MSKMNAATRNALPKQKFALPAERKYPINDHTHQVAAKQRASEMANKGKISASTKATIDAAANRAMHHGKADGSAMPHETHTPHADNVMGMHQFKKGTTHPDSKGNNGLAGDGKDHWSRH